MNKKILSILVGVVLVSLLIPIMFGCSGSKGKSIENAEAQVKSYAYDSLGIVAKNFKSRVIYEKGDTYLIEVKFSAESNDWLGEYCVYTKNGYVCNATTMLHPDVDCKEDIEEIKALFGIY